MTTETEQFLGVERRVSVQRRSQYEIDVLCDEVRRAIVAATLLVLFGIACIGGTFIRFIIWPAMNG